MYLLDTNTCIRYLNRRSEPVIKRLETINPRQIAVCSIVKAEMCFGAMRSHDPEQSLAAQKVFLDRFVSWSFGDSACLSYAQLRADLVAQGTPIGPNDRLIAAISLANHAILITHNTREFSRVKGLQIEDWELDIDAVDESR